MKFTWTTEHTADELDAGIVAFERADERQTVLVVINVSDEHVSTTRDGSQTMQTSFPEGSALTDAIGGGHFQVGPDGRLGVQVRPRQAMLLVASDQLVAR